MDQVRDILVRGRITSATQLTFDRGDSDGEYEIRWEVVEFTSGVSVQTIVTSFFTDTTDATITAVNVDKTFVVISSYTTATSTGIGAVPNSLVTALLTSATNVRIAQRAAIANTHNVNVFVVEFTG